MRFIARCLAAFLFIAGALSAGPAQAASRPSAPRSVKAVAGNHAVTVRWIAPARNGGAAVNRYAVQRWAPAKATWVTVKTTTGRTRVAVVSGLANGTSYKFRVRAHNRVGWGRASTAVSARPVTPQRPSAPLIVGLDYQRVDGHYNVTVTWIEPANHSAVAPTGYRVLRSSDGGASFALLTTRGPSARSYVDTTAAGSTAYVYRVIANSVNGPGYPSDLDTNGPLPPATGYDLSVSTNEVTFDAGSEDGGYFDVMLSPVAEDNVTVGVSSDAASVTVDHPEAVVQHGTDSIRVFFHASNPGTAIITVTLGAQQREVTVHVNAVPG